MHNHVHVIEFYACGAHVKSQCRCTTAEKRKTVSNTECPICIKKEKPTEETS